MADNRKEEAELMDVDSCSANRTAVDTEDVPANQGLPLDLKTFVVKNDLEVPTNPKRNRLKIVVFPQGNINTKNYEIEPQHDSDLSEKSRNSRKYDGRKEDERRGESKERKIKNDVGVSKHQSGIKKMTLPEDHDVLSLPNLNLEKKEQQPQELHPSQSIESDEPQHDSDLSEKSRNSRKYEGRKEDERRGESKERKIKNDVGVSKHQSGNKKMTLPEDHDVLSLPNLNLEKKEQQPQELHPSQSIESDDEEAFHDLDENTDPTQDCDSLSDIEGLINGLKEFNHHKWTPTPHSRTVGKSGSCYEGDFDGQTMSGMGTLHSSDKREFIQGMWRDNMLYELHSCQFIDKSADQRTIYMRKQANSYLLTCDEDEFVARAQLRYSDQADFSLPFRTIKIQFLQNLTITEVIEDRIQSTRKSVLETFKRTLQTVLCDSSNPINFATVLITLRKYLRKNSAKAILTSMMKNENIPIALRDAANSLLISENDMFNRRLDLFKFSRQTQPPKLEVKTVIQTAYTEAINCHKQSLIDKCPSSLPSLTTNITDLPPDKVIYISKDDIELFAHLASMTKEHDVLTFFDELHLGLFDKLRKFESSSPPNVVMPLSSPVYGFLFKSFLEIVAEIGLKAENCSVSTMFFHEQGKWKLADEIVWNQEVKPSNRTSLIQKSLDCQYRFIYKLLCHFDPKYFSLDKDFDYQFEILNKEDPENSWWKKQFKSIKKLVMRQNNLDDIPQDRKIWLYILDHTIHKVMVQNSPDSTSCLELFRPMLDGLITFITGCPTNSYESFRVVTHNALMFEIQAISHFQDKEKLSDKDSVILENLMKYITVVSTDMKSGSSASSDFRNLIEEYSRYSSLRHLLTVDESLCPAYLVTKIKEIHALILMLVGASLEKSVNVPSLVKYFRELNDFIEDFKNIDFPGNWYIKSNISRPGIIEKVDNKIASESTCSYKVIDLKRFIEVYENGCPPQHHIIHIVSRLLECAIKSLTITWMSDSEQSVAQLEATGALLCAMRSSFLYLKEQPDYRDFEKFSNESVNPFLQVVDRCHVLEEFKIRVNVVKESFWYIRKMDEIGITQALELFNKLNHGSLNVNKLKQCYDKYVSKYDEYIGDANRESDLSGVNALVESVTNNKADYKEIAKWDEVVKTEKLPTLLAGLSAVWSLLVSKDVRSSGKFLKPHCIQVLCIMRLLSLDGSSRGVEHHLAQVLTGQGKSVILGLLSAVLAFTGNKVRVLCYSDYLAKRDEKDFEKYFNTLGITQSISYGTFMDMANEFVNPVFQGKQVSLRDMVKSFVLEHCSLKKLGTPSSDVSRTVLLIDEVDVFFSSQFYGYTYNAVVACTIPGMALIQEKIWKMASGNTYEPNALYRLIQEFIEEGVRSGNQDLKEYNKFRLKSGEICLLDNGGSNLSKIDFTNRSLLEKHVMEMVQTAIKVSKGTINDCYINWFKIIDGLICCFRSEDGVYSSSRFFDYFNTFNYFRLKEADFYHKSNSNYGYILLSTGRISYAKLPEEFPLILGVSGTVSCLSAHEKEAIRSYNINSFSLLPTFFGDSNLKFNEVDNCCVLDSEKGWGSKIFERINSVLQNHRAVLVFFDTDLRLNSFQKDYGNKYDRLNVLTENTDGDLKSKYIDEAGISNAVTLCSRGMGRGVDFKSSLAVEKKGGVHVIQTFFSVDVKEETQIKGRTARKDNKGSYELILCKVHLIEAKLLKGIQSDVHNYSSLHRSRLVLMKKEGAKNAERIIQSEKDHKLTMEFFGINAGRKK